MSPLQQTKHFIVDHFGRPVVGSSPVDQFIGAYAAPEVYSRVTRASTSYLAFFGACLLFKWKAAQWKPWAVVLAAALLGEAWDLRDSLVYHTRVDLAGNFHDIWNTMLVPTVLMLAARYTKVFRKS